MTKDFSILIGGKAGQGSRVAARLIGEIFNHLGYKVYIFEAYGSLIRGGHNFSQILASVKGTEAREKEIDFLLALDKKTIDLHQKELKKGGRIIFNADRVDSKKGLGIEIEKIAKDLGGRPIMANTALISSFAKIIGVNWDVLEKVLRKGITHQIDLNLKIARRAFEQCDSLIKIKKLAKTRLSLLLTGNEAVALGMAKAGLDFYVAYPMTPATSIMNTLAKREDLGVKVIQAENEISVINMALGVAFAGKKAAVGTSGGGFALMVETLSLAGQSETPILIIESQRGAPATGMPTYNSQGDLLFVLSAGHGDIPRFVIAPGDAEQAAFYSGLGLNLAWKYQTPVILLLDKDVSENTFFVNEKIANLRQFSRQFTPILWERKEGEYKRYKITRDGISPLAFPGQKGAVVKSTSYEHDEYGITIEDAKPAKIMQEKRLKKMEEMKKEVEKLPSVAIYGNKKSKTALISFGISKGAAIEAAERLKVKAVQPIIPEPFPQKKMEKALKGVRKIFTVELNATGQLAKFLAQNGIKTTGSILKYDGRPFFAQEIVEKLRKII